MSRPGDVNYALSEAFRSGKTVGMTQLELLNAARYSTKIILNSNYNGRPAQSPQAVDEELVRR